MPKDWLEWHPTCHHADDRLMEYADKFLAEKERIATHGCFPMLFYVWGHSYEFDNQNNWDLMEKFLRKISGQEDVWYATNGEIYNYVQAYHNLQFSSEGTFVYNPNVLDVYICYIGKNYCIPAGKMVDLETL
jgi:hypothetical protein